MTKSYSYSSSLVLSLFSWERFFLDQSITWSTATWALLPWPLGIHAETVLSFTYFHVSKTLDTERSSIITKNSQGPSLVPWGTLEGTLPHSDRQALLSFTHCNLLQRKSMQLVGQDVMVDKVKCLSVIEEKLALLLRCCLSLRAICAPCQS